MEKYTDLMKQYLLIHGHSLDLHLVEIDDTMANFMVELSTIDTDYETFRLKGIRRSQVLRMGKEFYDTYFIVHDIYYAIDKMIHKINGYNIENYEMLLQKFNQVGQKISPYTLPVKFNQKKEEDGYLSLLSVDIDSDDFLRDMKPYFSKISLKKYPTILTSTSYIHELAHLEIESNKCSIVDYNNSEAIPIFLEFISLMEKPDLFIYNLYKRINFLLIEFNSLISYYFEPEKGVTEYQVFITSKYIISLLKAFKLLEIYYNGSILKRREILFGIQKIFDKDRIVEDLFSDYDINMDSCLNIENIKKLIKG